MERAETVEWHPERALVQRPTRVANDQHWKNLRYTLVRPLGRGAFGQVHLAMDNEAKRYVAVKEIDVAHGGGGDGDSGVTEAEILSLLRPSCATSGVLCLENVFREGQHAFLVTEALDEYDTMDTVKIDRTAEHSAFLPEVVDQLGRAVQGAHRLGVAHRDLKPSNIMIRRPASVKIIDFGVACAQDRCPTRELAGTPIYLAPELWSESLLAWETEGDARQTDREFSTEDWQAADWWALGATVAEFLLGRPFLLWWWETVFPRDVVNRRDLRARLPTLRRRGVPLLRWTRRSSAVVLLSRPLCCVACIRGCPSNLLRGVSEVEKSHLVFCKKHKEAKRKKNYSHTQTRLRRGEMACAPGAVVAANAIAGPTASAASAAGACRCSTIVLTNSLNIRSGTDGADNWKTLYSAAANPNVQFITLTIENRGTCNVGITNTTGPGNQPNVTSPAPIVVPPCSSSTLAFAAGSGNILYTCNTLPLPPTAPLGMCGGGGCNGDNASPSERSVSRISRASSASSSSFSSQSLGCDCCPRASDCAPFPVPIVPPPADSIFRFTATLRLVVTVPCTTCRQGLVVPSATGTTSTTEPKQQHRRYHHQHHGRTPPGTSSSEGNARRPAIISPPHSFTGEPGLGHAYVNKRSLPNKARSKHKRRRGDAF